MTSKAARIRELYAQGLGTGEIARIVGCKPEYVRVAGRQRAGQTYSRADKAWLQRRWGGDTIAEMWRRRYAQDPVYREHIKTSVKASRERKRASKGLE